MTGLMIFMTKAGFAVAHRHFSQLAYLLHISFCHLDLRVFSTPLLVIIARTYSFFYHWRLGCPKRTNMIPRPGSERLKQTCLLPFGLVPVILSEGPISLGFLLPPLAFVSLSLDCLVSLSCFSILSGKGFASAPLVSAFVLKLRPLKLTVCWDYG